MALAHSCFGWLESRPDSESWLRALTAGLEFAALER